MTLHHWPNPRVPWRSFRNHWVVRLVEYLNQGVLPQGFRAWPTELIVGVEPDVLLLREADTTSYKMDAQPALTEATLTAILPPPAELPIVGIYSAYDTSRLVSAIELVSPGNKDRTETTQAFVEKVLFLLQEGVHVMVVDVISLPKMPVRLPLLNRLGLDEPAVKSGQLWTSSYCSLPGDAPHPQIIVREWAEELNIGGPLPTLPLFLQTDQLWVSVDLDKSYQETLEAGRYEPV